MNSEDTWTLNCPGESIVARSPAALVRRVPSLFRMSGEVMVGDRSVVFAPDDSYFRSVRTAIFASSAVAILAVVLAFPGLLGYLLGLYVLASAALVHTVTRRMARSSSTGYRFDRTDVTSFDLDRGFLELVAAARAGPLFGALRAGSLRVRLRVRTPVSLVGHIEPR